MLTQTSQAPLRDRRVQPRLRRIPQCVRQRVIPGLVRALRRDGAVVELLAARHVVRDRGPDRRRRALGNALVRHAA